MNIATIPQRTHDPRLGLARSSRRHPRLQAHGVASHLQTRDGSTGGLPVENISMGGLFVRSAAMLERGTPVMVQVVRPGLRRAIQVTGHVVSAVTPADARARGVVAGMGIRFDPIDGDAAERLRGLIDTLAAVTPRAPAATTATPRAAAPSPPMSNVAPTPVLDATFLELAEVKGTIEEQNGQIQQLLAEVKELRKELLRRNRTIGDMANRLASYEARAV